MEIALPPPKYVEVEVLHIPLWMLLLQGIQFAVVFMVLMYVLYGGQTYLEKEREIQAYEALREKEERESVYMPPQLSSRLEEFKIDMRRNNK